MKDVFIFNTNPNGPNLSLNMQDNKILSQTQIRPTSLVYFAVFTSNSYRRYMRHSVRTKWIR